MPVMRSEEEEDEIEDSDESEESDEPRKAPRREEPRRERWPDAPYFPEPDGSLFDVADDSLMASAKASGNTMVVHFQPVVPEPLSPPLKAFWMKLPSTCTVAFTQRQLCRHVLKGMYPSFVRLTMPVTGVVLERCWTPPAAGVAPLAAQERTLAGYGVQHDSKLQIQLVLGDVFEASVQRQLQPRGVPLSHAGPRVATTGAGGAPGSGQAPAAGAAATVGRAAEAQYVARQPRTGTVWSREEILAVIDGMLKHGGGRWQKIEMDSRGGPLEGRDWNKIKMAFNNLDQRVKKKGWESTRYAGDDEVRAKFMQARQVINKNKDENQNKKKNKNKGGMLDNEDA